MGDRALVRCLAGEVEYPAQRFIAVRPEPDRLVAQRVIPIGDAPVLARARFHAWEKAVALHRVHLGPFSRGAPEVPIDYPESGNIQALLDHIDRGTPTGQRDYALFALMFNTGARVQEVLDLRVRDLRLDAPEQVRLHGKGEKIRLCPLWPRTAKLLRDLIASQVPDGPDRAASLVFRNRNGGQLTRFGVRYLLRKHLPEYRSAAQGRRIHPHALRHATAAHLLKSGVESATISQLLGHASLATTMRYARADLDLKRQALSKVFPESLGAPTAGRVRWQGAELARWLRRL
jgi:integrase/recombinase XerD